MTEITGGPSAFVAIAKQTAKGTIQSSAAAFVFAKYLPGTDVQPTQEYLGPVREGGDGLDQRFDIQVAHRARGTIVVHARGDIAGMAYSAFFGAGLGGNAASAWGGGSNPATHIFQFPGAGRSQYYTIIVQHPGAALTQVMSDARCVTLTQEAQNRQPARLTTEWVGIIFGASVAIPAPVYETGDVFGFWNASLTFPYNGSAASWISRYAVNAQIEVDEELFTQGLVLADIVDLNRTVTVEVDEVFQNPTVYMAIEYKSGLLPSFALATGVFKINHVVNGSRSLGLEANAVRFGDSRLTPIDPENKTVMVMHQGIALAAATSSLVGFVSNNHASNYLA